MHHPRSRFIFGEDIVLTLLCCEQINVGARDFKLIVAIVYALVLYGQSYLYVIAVYSYCSCVVESCLGIL